MADDGEERKCQKSSLADPRPLSFTRHKSFAIRHFRFQNGFHSRTPFIGVFAKSLEPRSAPSLKQSRIEPVLPSRRRSELLTETGDVPSFGYETRPECLAVRNVDFDRFLV